MLKKVFGFAERLATARTEKDEADRDKAQQEALEAKLEADTGASLTPAQQEALKAALEFEKVKEAGAKKNFW